MTREQIKRAMTQWIDSNLQPNTIAVATLKQAIGSDDKRPDSRWIRGSEVHYEHAYGRFIRHLSADIYRKAWKRHKKLVPNAFTLEGNGNGHKLRSRKTKTSVSFMNGIQPDDHHVRWHMNMLFRRPDWISPEDFEAKLRKHWQLSDWALPDFLIEEHDGKFTAYALKDGPEALLTDSLSF